MNEQRTEAWIQARLGKLTASRLADAIAKTKSGWGASRANLMAQLIAERLTGVPAESYSNAAMQWGVDHEDEARSAYEFYQDVTVEQVGFVEHKTIPLAGASPDGIIAIGPSLGLVEIKCPNTATHIETLLGQEIPAKYITQMMFQMACTGAMWCDFVSFDPRMPEALRLFVKRLGRDNTLIAQLESEAVAFLAEVETKANALLALLQQKAA